MPDRDPAEWSSASVEPALEGLDGLHDLLMEVAAEELRKVIPDVPKKFVARVARICEKGIETARAHGFLASSLYGDQEYSKHFLETLARLVAEIIDAGPNASLHAKCIDVVFGLGIQLGISQDAIALQHGMGKSNVSKICVEMRERYNVPPSRGMKSVVACKNYSIRQTGKRARPAREEWGMTNALKNAIYGPAFAA